MGVTAIWTAVHYRIPILFVIVNNHSYFNDELHQEHLAVARGRPAENKWIGQQMLDPELDLATLARGQGAVGFGQITELRELCDVLREAIAVVDTGRVAVVDVHASPAWLCGAGYRRRFGKLGVRWRCSIFASTRVAPLRVR